MTKEQEDTIDRIINAIRPIGEELRDDLNTPAKTRAPQMDIVLDVMKFLNDYEENVVVLNQYWSKKRLDEKFRGGENNEKPSRERE